MEHNRKNKASGFQAIINTVKMAYQLEKTAIILNAVLALINAVNPYIGVFLSARIIDGLITGDNFTQLIIITVIGTGIIFVSQILEKYVRKIRDIHMDMALHNYEMNYTKKMIEMDYAQLESPLTADILNHIRTDNTWGSGFWGIFWLTNRIFGSIFGFSTSIGVMIPLFVSGNFFKGYFTPVSFFILLLMAIITVLFNAKYIIKKDYTLMNETNTDKNYMFYFVWGGIGYKEGKDIRIYNTGELIQDYMKSGEKWWKSWTHRITRLKIKAQYVNGIFSGILQCGVYAVVIIHALTGMLSIGDIIKYVAAIINFMNGISSMMDYGTYFAEYSKHQQSTLEYFNIPDVLFKGTLTTEKRTDNEYEIEFRNVSFKYPGSKNYALKNFNLKFNIGQRMAVVGMNGSGKTTMIKLLCRLYDPTDGEITLNCIDIKKYNHSEYMNIFSVVFQDFKLFSFSLGQNVAAAVDYNSAQADECLRKAGFGGRLSNMPKGLETSLYKDFEEDGVEISGGEAQKIALARALYKDAPFIVLDEPTAALDPIAEFEIYSKFNEIVGNKTAIYISHRLSSCRFCDDIAVLHEGGLMQRGSHDTLIADESGKYYELWNAQAQYYAENNKAESIPIVPNEFVFRGRHITIRIDRIGMLAVMNFRIENCVNLFYILDTNHSLNKSRNIEIILNRWLCQNHR